MLTPEIVKQLVVERFGSIENMKKTPMPEVEAWVSFKFSTLPPNPHYTYKALDIVKELRKNT